VQAYSSRWSQAIFGILRDLGRRPGGSDRSLECPIQLTCTGDKHRVALAATFHGSSSLLRARRTQVSPPWTDGVFNKMDLSEGSRRSGSWSRARVESGDLGSRRTASETPLAKQKDCRPTVAVPVMHSRSTAQKRQHMVPNYANTAGERESAEQAYADRLSLKTRWWGGLAKVY
jgi:hypothetical protein